MSKSQKEMQRSLDSFLPPASSLSASAQDVVVVRFMWQAASVAAVNAICPISQSAKRQEAESREQGHPTKRGYLLLNLAHYNRFINFRLL